MSAFPSLLLQGLQGLYTTQYAELASSTIIVYDHFVTLDQEVELIWKSGWSFGKCLFLVNRYYTLFVVVFNNYVLFNSSISSNLCATWFRWQGISGILSFTMGELILQLRLYALYSLNRKVLVLMGTVFAATFITSATIMGFALARIKTLVVPKEILGVSICTPSNLHEITFFFAFWIPIMTCEALLCALVIFKAVRGWRRRENLRDSGKALVTVLIRDSIFYFLVLFVVYLTNTIIFVGGDAVRIEAAVNYAVSMSCVIGNRLCLNVRGMIWKDEDVIVTHSFGLGRRHGHATHPSTSRVHQQHGQAPQRWPVVVFANSTDAPEVPATRSKLSDYEMDELRTMRVGHGDGRGYPLIPKDQFTSPRRAGRV